MSEWTDAQHTDFANSIVREWLNLRGPVARGVEELW